MRIVSEAELTAVLSRVAGLPRVVVSGNFATPVTALAVVDKALAEYRLFAALTRRREPVTGDLPDGVLWSLMHGGAAEECGTQESR
jgi:hypothetical protein